MNAIGRALWVNALLAIAGSAAVASGPAPVGDRSLAGNAAADSGAVAAVGGNASATMSTATGSTTARSMAARAADVINIMDFGAKGDDTTDDTAAINAALAYARTKLMGNNAPYTSSAGPLANIVFPGGHRFRQNGTLNFTGFSRGLIVTMGGAALDCHAKGLTCIDAYDTSAATWNQLTLVGDATDMPKIGLAQGRSTYANGAFTQAAHVLYNDPTITGQFSFAGYYNFAGEILTMFHPSISNYSGLTGAYAVVEDGYNHFGVTSSFITSANPAPANTWASFNENLWIEGSIQANIGNGIPFWVGGAMRLKFVNTYAAGGSPTCTTCYGMVLYNTGGTNTTLADFDINFETTYLTDVFFFTGDNTLAMDGFHFREPQAGATNSILKMDKNMTQIQLTHAEIEMAGLYPGAKLFDNPANWRVFGSYTASSMTGFNPPAYGELLVTIGGQTALTSYGGAPISAQIADGTKAGGNARGAYSVDEQSIRDAITEVASGQYATIAGGGYNTASGLGSFVGGFGSTASGYTSAALGTTQANGDRSFTAGYNSHAAGTGSSVVGIQGDDHGNSGTLAASGGQFTTGGDAQAGRHVLSGSGNTASAFRLTVGGAAVSPATCLAVPAYFSFGMAIHLHASDYTTRGTDYDWYLPQATLTLKGSASTALYTAGPTAASVLSAGTVTGAAVTVSADTTNGCLNLSFIPPSANTTDTWHAVAVVDTVEMQ